jgi:hypothetical protein
MRERRARLSLITIAALAVVVPGGAAGLAEHSSGLAAGGRPATWSMMREPDGSYSATLASGDRVYSKVPSALPAAHHERAETGPLPGLASTGSPSRIRGGSRPRFPGR